jgi:SAM-dependent methyltransferase
MDVAHLSKNWDELAREDPLWAVLTDPAKQNGQWNEEEFYRTGDYDAIGSLNMIKRVLPDLCRGSALDFGCGVGRVTFALKKHFDTVTGVDISETMLRFAASRNPYQSGVNLVWNQSSELGVLEDESFDLVYSRIVLQHMHPDIALAYVREFTRVLKPNGACIFQIPADSELQEDNPPRDGNVKMEMWGISPSRVLSELEAQGVDLLLLEKENACGNEIASYNYIFTK